MVHDRAGDRVVLRPYAVDSDAPSALNRVCLYVGEFGKQLRTAVEQEVSACADRLKQRVRSAPPEQCRDHRIGVQNQPHPRAQRALRWRSAR